MKFTIIIILLSIMSSSSVNSFSHLRFFCPEDKGNFNRSDGKDGFAINLKIVLEGLSSNTMLDNTVPGFNNSSVENQVNEVYGQALCRGDVSDPETCRGCVQAASRDLLENCTSKDAIVWYDLCQIRYSFQKFFATMTYTGKYPEPGHLKNNISGDLVHPFVEARNRLMNEIVDKAAFSSSNRMFATGAVRVSGGGTIFSAVQCSLDISPELCRNCLGSSLGDLNACCSFREGGFVVSRTCTVRFELFRFFNKTSDFYDFTSEGDKEKTRKRITIAISASASLLVTLLCFWVVFLRLRNRADRDMRSERDLLREFGRTTVTIDEEGRLLTSDELSFVDLATIRHATNNFDISNKLGQGGFGTVYKCVFEDGKEVAVKRLSRKSWQGSEEFRNEIILIAELQHRNLARLVGCSIGEDEKLLLYEFMQNRSLDFFIYDSERRSQLNWETYYNIITGISKGLLYLHEDSRLKIIHRDLKPSNVLLDHEMVAKISDFGMARIFCEDQKTANTKRVVGTFNNKCTISGYMAPEYAMGGLFSVKSDVFSFGIILLEIISGQKNNGFHLTKHAQTLISYAWKLWKEGKELEIVDPMLIDSNKCPIEDIKRCIHIGLLCVQEDPTDRPTMRDVVVLLPGSEWIISSLPEPREPAFAVGRLVQTQHPNSDPLVNGVTMPAILPR